MATCTNCGADLSSTDKFCGGCGTRAAVGETATAATVAAAERPSAEPDGAPERPAPQPVVAAERSPAAPDGASERPAPQPVVAAETPPAEPDGAPSQALAENVVAAQSDPSSTAEGPSFDALIDQRVGLWGTLDGATSRAKSIADKISGEELGTGGAAGFDLSAHPDPFDQLDDLRVAADTQISLLRDANKAIEGHRSAIAEIKRKQTQKVIAVVVAAVVLIIIIANALGG